MAKFNKSKEWLIEEYVIKNRPRAEVASECGLTVSGLKSLLIKLDIKKEKLAIKEDVLKSLVNQGKHVDEIAKELNCSENSIYRALHKFNLKIIALPRLPNQYDDSLDDKIKKYYLEDKLSSTQIGELLGVSHTYVLTHLKHMGIERRSFSESHFAFNQKEYPIELLDKDTIYDLYINLKKSKKELGKIFNCDPCVIDRVLKQFEIPIRGTSEAHIGLMTGDKHPNWKGGVTSLNMRLREYFYVQQVPKILARDHYCCQYEGCKNKKYLHVHHIIPFSKILERIRQEHSDLNPIENVNELYEIATKDIQLNDLNNLITYCADCHRYKIHSYKRNDQRADNKPIELLENLNEKDVDNQQLSSII